VSAAAYPPRQPCQLDRVRPCDTRTGRHCFYVDPGHHHLIKFMNFGSVHMRLIEAPFSASLNFRWTTNCPHRSNKKFINKCRCNTMRTPGVANVPWSENITIVHFGIMPERTTTKGGIKRFSSISFFFSPSLGGEYGIAQWVNCPLPKNKTASLFINRHVVMAKVKYNTNLLVTNSWLKTVCVKNYSLFFFTHHRLTN
jgi:hypothetical protein